jgi:hypothetical protein
MTKNEFLNTKVKNCICGNKVKPHIERVPDMGTTLECPRIGCNYCDTYSDLYYPNEYEKCLKDWDDKVSK